MIIVTLRKRPVVEHGVELDGVWLPIAMLHRLAKHSPWDNPFTEATADQERVLVQHSLADPHHRQGVHRGTGLSGFLDAIPFRPAVQSPVAKDNPKDDAAKDDMAQDDAAAAAG